MSDVEDSSLRCWPGLICCILERGRVRLDVRALEKGFDCRVDLTREVRGGYEVGCRLYGDVEYGTA